MVARFTDPTTWADNAWLNRFIKRSAVFAVVGPTSMVCVRAGSPWLDILATASGTLSAKEAASLVRSSGLPADARAVELMTALLIARGFGAAAIVGGLHLAQSVRTDLKPDALKESALSFIVATSVGLPLRLVVRLRRKADGLRWLEWGMFTAWLNDATAYLVGPHMGGSTLPSWINSQKTWLGYVPGVVLSALSGFIYARRLKLQPGSGLALGAAVGASGAVGDILESALKRAAKAKDSGSILPGYGGVLDRLDSFMTTVLLIAAVQRFTEIEQISD